MATSLVDDTTGSKVLAPPSHLQVIPDRSTAPEVITVSGTSNATNQLSVGIYELISTTATHFLQGANTVTATTSSHFLPANQREYVIVTNTTTKGYVAAIQNASSGSMFVTRLTSKA